MTLNINKSDRELEKEYQEAVISGLQNERKIKAVLLAGILVVLGGVPIILGYFTYQAYSSHLRLNKGTKTTATLNNEYTEVKSNRNGTKYNVSYSFTVEGRKYVGDGSVKEKPISKIVTIFYDTSDPSNNKIEGDNDFFEEMGQVVIFALVAGVVGNIFIWGFKSSDKLSFRRSKKPKKTTRNNNFSAKPNKTKFAEDINKFQISTNSILWIEKELLRLNKEFYGEQRPPYDDHFLQTFPNVLLKKDNLTANDVVEAAITLAKQTRKLIGEKKVPFRKPRVEFTSVLPNNEPGHIEFRENETIIRIHPNYKDDNFALASILCHEMAHFILDHNGLKKNSRIENEKLTDLFIFFCGQGLIHLQGIVDITSENGQTVESRLGYLSLEEMAYAHARCAAQHGLAQPQIAPAYFTGKAFEKVRKAIEFLKLKKDSSKLLAEIILCPNDHILRVSTEKPSQTIRCPKCKWEKQLWLHKSDNLNFLMNQGIQAFDFGNFNEALECFRKVQSIERKQSLAYCWASRCLKRMGRKQDAIRELKKLLSICPEDQIVQNEMKTLIYE